MVLTWALAAVLAGSIVLRLVLYDGAFWDQNWAAFLIGLVPALIVVGCRTVALPRRKLFRVSGTTLTRPDGTTSNLTVNPAEPRLTSSVYHNHPLHLWLNVAGSTIDLTDPVTGKLRAASDLASLADTLRRTDRAEYTPVVNQLAALSAQGLVAGLQPTDAGPPEAPHGNSRLIPLIRNVVRGYVAVMILFAMPFYLVTRLADGQVLGHIGAFLLFFTAAAFTLHYEVVPYLLSILPPTRVIDGVARLGPFQVPLHRYDSQLVGIGHIHFGFSPLTRRVWRMRGEWVRPALLITNRWGLRLRLDLADRATAQLRPAHELHNLAQALELSGNPSAALAARQLRELAGWRWIKLADTLADPIPKQRVPLSIKLRNEFNRQKEIYERRDRHL